MSNAEQAPHSSSLFVGSGSSAPSSAIDDALFPMVGGANGRCREVRKRGRLPTACGFLRCTIVADDGDARRSSSDRLSLVARVLEDDGDLALAPLAGDARPSEDDARPTFQWTTSKRARKRRPFSRGDVGFRCWAPVEIGAGNGRFNVAST